MIIVVESADELVILADSVVINFTWLHNESLGGLIIYIREGNLLDPSGPKKTYRSYSQT
jgi:hypothetical protein